jgi:hypothetical protein
MKEPETPEADDKSIHVAQVDYEATPEELQALFQVAAPALQLHDPLRRPRCAGTNGSGVFRVFSRVALSTASPLSVTNGRPSRRGESSCGPFSPAVCVLPVSCPLLW